MFEDFEDITGFDIETYFRRFVTFITDQSQNIIDYYSGLTDTLDRDSFAEYEALLTESIYVVDLFDLNNERFNTVDFWELMEYADDIRIKLETIGNFSKFARSSVKKASFDTNVTMEVPTYDNETIEQLLTRLGSTDRENDWAEIAISNRLEQEDYTLDGGVLLNVSFKNNTRFFVEGIIDNPEGDRIKGLDIDKKITFEDNDLKVLSYDETLKQSLDVLINLRKNDNPEFPQYGIDPSLIVGMNIKSIALPSLVRQIFQTFSTNDRVDKIEILNVDIDGDSVSMDLSIVIKSGEEQKIVLNL